MRSDMHKVICESPRYNPGPGKNSRRKNLPFDLLPGKEGIRRPHQNTLKSFGEHLGPLKRWLRSQVGKPWNDVYSEACQVIKPDNVVRAHIKTHLLDFVIRDTFMRNGEVWCLSKYGWFGSREMPIAHLIRWRKWHPFYVHPETGRLWEMPTFEKPIPLNKLQDAQLAPVRRWISEDQLLVKWRGIWFRCRMQNIAKGHAIEFDLFWRSRLCASHAREAYDKSMFCVKKRQLSRKELRQHKLTNSVEDSTACLRTVLGDDFAKRVAGSNGNPLAVAFSANELLP